MNIKRPMGSYKEYFSPELSKDEEYVFFQRELTKKLENYSKKEIQYYLEFLPLYKQSAVLNKKK